MLTDRPGSPCSNTNSWGRVTLPQATQHKREVSGCHPAFAPPVRIKNTTSPSFTCSPNSHPFLFFRFSSSSIAYALPNGTSKQSQTACTRVLQYELTRGRGMHMQISHVNEAWKATPQCPCTAQVHTLWYHWNCSEMIFDLFYFLLRPNRNNT